MIVPIAFTILTAGAYVAQSRRKPKAASPRVQAERAVIYETLINDTKDPILLRRFAQAFREQGCFAEADMLEKRAALRELPPEAKTARSEAYKKGMASKDPAAVRALSKAFADTGATGAAAALLNYANSLETLKANASISEDAPKESDNDGT